MTKYVPHPVLGDCIKLNECPNEPCWGVVDIIYDTYGPDSEGYYEDVQYPACQGHFDALANYDANAYEADPTCD